MPGSFRRSYALPSTQVTTLPNGGDGVAVLDPTDRKIIASLGPLRGLDHAALDTVLADARVLNVDEGQTCFTQGTSAGAFFLMIDGRMKVTQLTPEGQQVVILMVGPGEFFGLAAAIGRDTFPGTATAAIPSRIVAWPTPAWERMVTFNLAIAREAMLTMGRRLQEMHARLREISTERVEQRIAHAILRLVQQSGRRVEGGVMIDFPITRQDIAEMTGTTLHTVSRTLSAWEQSGVLDGGRRRIIVRNPHALVRIAGD